jgi:hypothetical protein
MAGTKSHGANAKHHMISMDCTKWQAPEDKALI